MKKLMARVQGLRQKLAGKSIPIKKFITRESGKCLSQSDKLHLHEFRVITHVLSEVISREIIPPVDGTLGELGFTLSSEGSESRRVGLRKDVLRSWSQGVGIGMLFASHGFSRVCWRFVAYPVLIILRIVFLRNNKLPTRHLVFQQFSAPDK
ncbi:hypothetical protein DEU56DRAFT_249224 [Suillus clintonianus]|uniref:uncharacterized protein n=1 Tax=Suillus clintonianus TaxID=1904413 RepID=UPI001B872AF2|nr:uncharacterized protein DEU56DRAFT_249224 [Suillus clintonianus]KAG2143741.1 hypothetical protein DEU56DRAFT_249224 [Suillus clintonianus]